MIQFMIGHLPRPPLHNLNSRLFDLSSCLRLLYSHCNLSSHFPFSLSSIGPRD